MTWPCLLWASVRQGDLFRTPTLLTFPISLPFVPFVGLLIELGDVEFEVQRVTWSARTKHFDLEPPDDSYFAGGAPDFEEQIAELVELGFTVKHRRR